MVEQPLPLPPAEEDPLVEAAQALLAQIAAEPVPPALLELAAGLQRALDAHQRRRTEEDSRP